ncbi:5'-methylthioadenosine/S-adenosylhomocysteine nucleosidase [Buchananella hordeovulneris]|uniref:adenosylhomocysteine nucleosidase n=1 Tax=Buchananella hordeovulneris TaxID=52770 RepID=A0A1Q5PU97_9ACTO|nr:5'-methylthioadenosine/S-adenosylhomocysteine nucleosidase [Buchananella hordeovulneris]OKL51096.1 hypothetical protein BSZ40_09325 [Buchananella hordeovulneris]
MSQPVAVIVVAMPQEAAPFEAAARAAHPWPAGGAAAQLLEIADRPVVLLRTGIGLTAAASSLTALLTALPRVAPPPPVISAGTCGGLGAAVEVRDVTIGTSFAYADADARAFGYAPGQIPGQPACFPAAASLLTAVRAGVEAGTQTLPRLHEGQQLSGNSFVTATNAAAVRALFPDAVGVDMESAALAQVCFAHTVPFASVRGVSDLCGPRADQEFHVGVEVAAQASADVVLGLLTKL